MILIPPGFLSFFGWFFGLVADEARDAIERKKRKRRKKKQKEKQNNKN